MRHFEFPPDVLTAIEHDRFHHADPHVQRRMEALWLTVDENLREMHAAIKLHLDGLLGDHLPIPKPSSIARQIDVELPAA